MKRILLAFSPLVVACGSTESFTTTFAPGFAPTHHAISVFGVFKDGQMSAEAWDSFAPRLSSWLGSAQCRGGYVEGANARTDAPLWSAVDDYTRSNGPTDDLLTHLAPAAEGDLVLVLTIAGKVPQEEKTKLQDEPAGGGLQGGGRGGMGGMSGMRNPGAGSMQRRSLPAAQKDELDLAALVYSVAAKESVAQVSLAYTGHSLDEAFAKFSAKLRDTLPGAACAGWAWEGKVDAEAIRKLGD
jgi:hypothetical protein